MTTEHYIKALEEQNEKLQGLLTHYQYLYELEKNRLVFLWTKEYASEKGEYWGHESTIHKDKMRNWIKYIATDMLSVYSASFLCVSCWAECNKLDSSKLSWVMYFRRKKETIETTLPLWEKARWKIYKGNGEYYTRDMA